MRELVEAAITLIPAGASGTTHNTDRVIILHNSKHRPVRNRVLRICVLDVSLSNTSYSKVFIPIISSKLRLELPVSLFQDLGILTYRYLYASRLLKVFIEEAVTDILKQIHTTCLCIRQQWPYTKIEFKNL